MKVLYKAKAVNYGGRNGHVKVEDSPLEFDMSKPSILGKSSKSGGANPEQLFAAAYASCFGSAVEHVVRVNKMSLDSYAVAVEVGIGKDENDDYKLSAVITLKVIGMDQAGADTLIQEAHQTCPYSKATRGNIEVDLLAIADSTR